MILNQCLSLKNDPNFMRSKQRRFFLSGLCLSLVLFIGCIIVPRQVWELPFKIFLLFGAAITPINFHGKVIDENGTPVSGAETQYIVSTMSWTGSPTLEGPLSDQGGIFSIQGKFGPGISVFVTHPSYYITESARQQFTFSKLLAKKNEIVPTARNPAVFVLRRKGIAEPLIHQTIKNRLPMDGTPMNIVLRKGFEGAVDESLMLTLRSDGNKLPINKYYPFDWNLKIEVPGGSLLPRKDEFEFRAPPTGYQKSIAYSQLATTPRGPWEEGAVSDLFILLPSKCYARVQIRMLAMKGNCTMEVFLNPKMSSTNLEYDARMQVPYP